MAKYICTQTCWVAALATRFETDDMFETPEIIDHKYITRLDRPAPDEVAPPPAPKKAPVTRAKKKAPTRKVPAK